MNVTGAGHAKARCHGMSARASSKEQVGRLTKAKYMQLPTYRWSPWRADGDTRGKRAEEEWPEEPVKEPRERREGVIGQQVKYCRKSARKGKDGGK